MNIKRIIREELEDWEWTEGDIDLKYILELTLEDTKYFINMGNLSRNVDNDYIFIYEKGNIGEGHFSIFERHETLEHVLITLKDIYSDNDSKRITTEYKLLHDTIKQKSKELFGM